MSGGDSHRSHGFLVFAFQYPVGLLSPEQTNEGARGCQDDHEAAGEFDSTVARCARESPVTDHCRLSSEQKRMAWTKRSLSLQLTHASCCTTRSGSWTLSLRSLSWRRQCRWVRRVSPEPCLFHWGMRVSQRKIHVHPH